MHGGTAPPMASRWVLPAAVALVILLAALALLRGPASAPPDLSAAPTSYSYGPAGLRALYLLLRSEGRAAHRWTLPYRYLPRRGFLVIDQPQGFSARTRAALTRFLARGNGAWLITSRASLVQAFLSRPGRLVTAKPLPARPLLLAGRLAGVRRVVVDTPWRLPTWQPVPAVDWLGGPQGPVLTALPVGRGVLYLSTDPAPLANAYLGHLDDLRLTLNLLAARPGPILFDEYHHGYTSPLPATGPAPAVPAWVWALLLQGLAVVALAFWRVGRRFGPVVDSAAPSFPWAGEYVLSMARLLQRSGARRHALELLLAPLDRRAAAEPSAAQAAAEVRRALARGDPSEREFLDLARRVHTVAKELGEVG